MSKAGEQVTGQIEKLREYLEAQEGKAKAGPTKAIEFMHGVLDAVENINLRVQEIERDIGYNDAFVDPNDGSHRVK